MVFLNESGGGLLNESGGSLLQETVPAPLQPPVPNNWTARLAPVAADFNTYIRDTFNFLVNPPKLRAAANAVQSGVANNTWTVIQLQGVLEDAYKGWTAGVANCYTAQVPGWYGITWFTHAGVPAGYTGKVGLRFQINGTTIGPYEYDQNVTDASPWGWDCYDEIYLHTGDTVTPVFNHAYTAAVSTDVTFPSALEIVWISS